MRDPLVGESHDLARNFPVRQRECFIVLRDVFVTVCVYQAKFYESVVHIILSPICSRSSPFTKLSEDVMLKDLKGVVTICKYSACRSAFTFTPPYVSPPPILRRASKSSTTRSSDQEASFFRVRGTCQFQALV